MSLADGLLILLIAWVWLIIHKLRKELREAIREKEQDHE